MLQRIRETHPNMQKDDTHPAVPFMLMGSVLLFMPAFHYGLYGHPGSKPRAQYETLAPGPRRPRREQQRAPYLEPRSNRTRVDPVPSGLSQGTMSHHGVAPMIEQAEDFYADTSTRAFAFEGDTPW